MESKKNENLSKINCAFYCNLCHYGTSKKGNYNNHIMTTKHQKILIFNALQEIQSQSIIK